MRDRSILIMLLTLGVGAASCSSGSRDRGWSPLGSGVSAITVSAVSTSAPSSAAAGGESASGQGGASTANAGGNAMSVAGVGGAGGFGGQGPGQGGGAPTCVGPTPPAEAWMATPGPTFGSGGAGGGIQLGTPTIGQPPVSWTLPDIQPESCGKGATYGMEVFKGTVTVAVLLAGW